MAITNEEVLAKAMEMTAAKENKKNQKKAEKEAKLAAKAEKKAAEKEAKEAKAKERKSKWDNAKTTIAAGALVVGAGIGVAAVKAIDALRDNSSEPDVTIYIDPPADSEEAGDTAPFEENN